MPVGSSGVAGSRHKQSGTDAALDMIALARDPDLYEQRITELDAKQDKIAADQAKLNERHKELSQTGRELDAREKAVATREDTAMEREAALDQRETKLEAREQTVKDRQAECRRVEAATKAEIDKLMARQRAFQDCADLALRHDAMQGIGLSKVRAEGETPGPQHMKVRK